MAKVTNRRTKLQLFWENENISTPQISCCTEPLAGGKATLTICVKTHRPVDVHSCRGGAGNAHNEVRRIHEAVQRASFG